MISIKNFNFSYKTQSQIISLVGAGILAIVISVVLLGTLRNDILERSTLDAKYKTAQSFYKVDKYIKGKSVIIQQTSRMVSGALGLISDERDAEIEGFLRTLSIDYPEFVSIWVYYDNADGFGMDEVKEYHYYNSGGQLLVESQIIPKEELPADHLHLQSSLRKKEVVSDVYLSNLWDENVPAISYAVPFFFKGNLEGTVIADLSLHALSDLMTNEFIVSENDKLIFHPDQRLNAKFLKDSEIPDFQKTLLKENKINESTLDLDLDNYRISVIESFKIGKTNTYWRLVSSISIKELYGIYQSKFNLIFLLIVVGLALMTLGLRFINKKVTGALSTSMTIIEGFGNGNIDMDHLKSLRMRSLEGKKIVDGLNVLAKDLHSKTEFTQSLTKGNLDISLQPKEGDKLGSALLSLRDTLVTNEEEGKRRAWTNEGLAKFSDILRTNTDDFKELCVEIIGSLVKYLNTNQGVIFLLNQEDEEDKFLELTGAYAYERRKFIEAKVAIGEGLVGQCFQEKAIIHLSEIPEDYVRITSGLGKATPKSLLLVPLKLESEVNGVIELAGFRPFEEYEIAFVEKLAESISSTLHNVQNNERTRKLLETSQMQSEELKAAEEEMRQNMEELQATQEELNRRAGESEQLLRETEQRSEYSNIQIEITKALSATQNATDFYNTALEDICSYLYFDFATAWSVENGELKATSLYYSNDEDAHQQMINASSQWTGNSATDLVGSVIEHDQPLYFSNVKDEDGFGRRDEAIESGLKTCFMIPLHHGGEIISIVEFYMSGGEEDHEMMYEFIIQLEGVLSDQISRVILIEESNVVHDQISKQQKDLEAILNGLPIAMVVVNEEGKLELTNDSFLKLLNLVKQQIIDTSFKDLVKGNMPELEAGTTHQVSLSANDMEVAVEIHIESIQKSSGKSKVIQIVKN